MKRLPVKLLPLVSLIILCAVGALYWYSGQQQERYDASASAYLSNALADISSWERSALQRHLDDEALRTLSTEQLDAIAERYRPLGAFVKVEELQFTRLTAALSLFSNKRLLSYNGRAQFRQGSANVTATLIVRDGQFRVYNLSLSTPQPH